jgi:hypothetical protein
MGFNSGFKGLMLQEILFLTLKICQGNKHNLRWRTERALKCNHKFNILQPRTSDNTSQNINHVHADTINAILSSYRQLEMVVM